VNESRTEGRSPVTDELRRLRAQSGFTVREMAEALEMGATTYQHYESRWKERYFPPDFVERLVKILMPKGIQYEEILALAPPHPGNEHILEKIDEMFGQINELASDLQELRTRVKPN
jgi:transcriptional regulator with XRE-family HTH domain